MTSVSTTTVTDPSSVNTESAGVEDAESSQGGKPAHLEPGNDLTAEEEALLRKNEACWLQGQRSVGHTSAQSAWLRASWYCQVHEHRRDGVTAAFSAHNNNNSTLPTKLLELSSEDFLPPSTP